MCQWDVFLGIIHYVWCQMPWPNDLVTCLSQICLSWFVQEWICSTCLGVCVSLPMLFLWFTSLSLSFIHSDYALTNLVSLGNCSYDFIRHSYGWLFFLNAGWFLFPHQRRIAPHGLTRNRPRWDSRNSPWKAERRLFFLDLFWLFSYPGDVFFLWIFSTNLEWWKVFIWFFYGFFRWLVRDWNPKTSPLQRFHDYFHTTLLVVEIITKKIHQFNGTTLNPSKTTM